MMHDAQYVTRVNTEFMKIGLRGVSILVSSGDSGVHGRSDPGCIEPTFIPDYPGSSSTRERVIE